VNPSHIDFVAHAGSMGAKAVKAGSIAELEAALTEAKTAKIPTVIVIDTDPAPSTQAGGYWWDVAVPEVSVRPQVNVARAKYEAATSGQRLAD